MSMGLMGGGGGISAKSASASMKPDDGVSDVFVGCFLPNRK